MASIASVFFPKQSFDMCFQLRFGATVLALSRNFGMKILLLVYVQSPYISC